MPAVLSAIENPLAPFGSTLALVALITSNARDADATSGPLARPSPWRDLGRLRVIPVVATPKIVLLTKEPDPISSAWLSCGITASLVAVLFVVPGPGPRRRATAKARE